MKIILIAAYLIFSLVSAHANDSAVATSVGGLKLRKEHSVLMEKERLFISRELVRVGYEFRNTTKEAVVSEVAFPIPTFKYKFDDTGGRRDFSDFKAWIDGKPINVEKEVRAYVKERDVTEELRRAKITIETFGNFDPSDNDNEIMKLKPDVRDRLVKVGALSAPNKKDNSLDFWPEWKVNIKYHWRQEFPPGVVVRIKHEYRPVSGYTPVQVQSFKKQIKDSCINSNTYGEVKRRVAKTMGKEPLSNNYFGAAWVSYILTTANTWQTPIKDFELLVQGEKDGLLSFCWEGPVEKTNATQYRVRKTDFIPSKDIKIYFLQNF
jgi:hypothetical protein